MANMSYCRFQNTLGDLMDCQEKLGEFDGDLSDLRDDERRAAEALLRVCRQIASDFPQDDFDEDD